MAKKIIGKRKSKRLNKRIAKANKAYEKVTTTDYPNTDEGWAQKKKDQDASSKATTKVYKTSGHFKKKKTKKSKALAATVHVDDQGVFHRSGKVFREGGKINVTGNFRKQHK